MQAGQDPAVAGGIEQGQGKALVATGFLERVVADKSQSLERPPLRRLEDLRPNRDALEFARQAVDLLEVRIEDRLEAPPLGPPRDPAQARVERPRSARKQQTCDREQDDGAPKTDDDRAEIGPNERVEIDPLVLRGRPRV